MTTEYIIPAHIAQYPRSLHGLGHVLKHIGTTASVLANHNARRIVVAVALAQHAVVPAKKTVDLVGAVCGEFNIGFSTESIGAEILGNS